MKTTDTTTRTGTTERTDTVTRTTARVTSTTPSGARADRAAARTLAGARPPGRRDQRRPGTVRPRQSRHMSPHELFAERLLAVLSGRRPVHWMLGQTIGEAYEQLVRLAPGTPLRARGVLPVIRTCHGFQPRPGVVEACASVAAGEQVRAMAFRLEQSADLRWRCAAVELGGERTGRN
ncbi:Rv3235 family protein [Streptomyces sp. NPDC059568]|uniref:Rv3235 family protein n=1 Tax=Streptomyces sp. NPDC059568 TaxID=3346868 RepID=UPI0036C504C7